MTRESSASIAVDYMRETPVSTTATRDNIDDLGITVNTVPRETAPTTDTKPKESMDLGWVADIVGEVDNVVYAFDKTAQANQVAIAQANAEAARAMADAQASTTPKISTNTIILVVVVIIGVAAMAFAFSGSKPANS